MGDNRVLGDEKTTSQTTAAQTQRAQATPGESKLNELDLQLREQAQGGLLATQGTGFNLINQILSGGQLPGFLGQLPGGISPEAIGGQATQFAQRAGPGFQKLGISDSGTAFKETARGIANEVLFPAEQFNIGNLSNLLAQGIGGIPNVAGIGMGASNALGTRLAGLRPLTTTGQSDTTTTGMNPFLKSFQESLGSNLGSPKVSAGPFTFGG